MTPRRFVRLAGTTAALVVAATVAGILRPATHGGEPAAGPMLPGLLDRLNDVASLTIEGATVVTLEKGATGWSVRERGHFPADAGKVRATLLAMARLEKQEPKTRLPRHYPRLGVEDPDAGAGTARLVVARDGTGETLARLIVGRRSLESGTGDAAATYVRLPGDPRAWLARGDLAPSDALAGWIERDVIDLPRSRLRKVSVRHPDGGLVSAVRPDPAADRFAFETATAGGEGDGAAADALASALSGLVMDDAQPADRVPFDPARTLQAKFATLAGPVLGVALTRHQGEDWLRLSADMKAAPSAESEAELAERIRADVTRAAAKADGWVFRVPAYMADRFRKRPETPAPKRGKK